MSQMQNQITVNGEPRHLPESNSLKSLLDELELKHSGFAVELNGELITRDRISTTQLSDGDCVEVVTFVGGG